METVHFDLSGSYEASLGGSVYLIMFVDSSFEVDAAIRYGEKV